MGSEYNPHTVGTMTDEQLAESASRAFLITRRPCSAETAKGRRIPLDLPDLGGNSDQKKKKKKKETKRTISIENQKGKERRVLKNIKSAAPSSPD